MPQIFVAAKAIIENQGKYLVVKQKIGNGFVYDLPGGKIAFGESPEETLKREVREEVGLEIGIIRLLGVWWFFRKNDGDQVVCVTFLCKMQGGGINTAKNPSKAEVIEEPAWVSKDELFNIVAEESLKNIVKDL